MHRASQTGGYAVRLLVLSLLSGNVALVVWLLPDPAIMVHLAQVAELIAYPILVAGAGLLYVHYRLVPDGRTAWLTTAALFGSIQGVGYAAIRVAMDHYAVHHIAGLAVVDVAVALILVAMLASRPGSRGPMAPLLLGVTMALLVTTARVAVVARPNDTLPEAALETQPFLTMAMLALYGIAALLLLRRVPLPAWAARGLAVAALALAFAHVLTYPVAPPDWRSLLAAGLDIAGAFLLGLTALRLVRDALARLIAAESQVGELEEHVREGQVLLHEVSSTVAGIVAASHLVGAAQHLEPADRKRLEDLLDAERARLNRLLSRTGDEALSRVDLDTVLEPVVLSHRIRGRDVEWRAAGTWVLGRPGALTEVVDILLDNSAVHSGSRSVLVDTVPNGDLVHLRVSDDGCGIPDELSASLLDWGTRGANSTGSGIGLCLARRLVADMGGSLDVLSDGRSGTTVTVTLPIVDEVMPTWPASIIDRRVG